MRLWKILTLSLCLYFVLESALHKSHRKCNEAIEFKDIKPNEYNPVDDYFNAMNGEVEKYADTLYSFTPQFQASLVRWQNPESCDKSKFLVFQMWGFGLGSVYLGISAALSIAIETNRVLIFEYGKRGSFIHAIGCSSETAECFFKPVSHCQLEYVQSLVRSGKFSSRAMGNEELDQDDETDVVFTQGGKRAQFVLENMEKRISQQLPTMKKKLQLGDVEELKELSMESDSNRKRQLSMQLWTSQSLLYLMRLNVKTQEILRDALEGCFAESDSKEMMTKTLSLPIRGSDKCNNAEETVGEMHCVSPEQYFEIARRMQHMQPRIKSVIITSEDERLLNRTTKIFSERNWNVLKNTFDLHQGTGKSGAFNSEKEAPPNYVVTHSMLSSLTCQLFAGYRILTTKSNFHLMISALSRVVPGKTWDFSYEAGDLPD